MPCRIGVSVVGFSGRMYFMESSPLQVSIGQVIALLIAIMKMVMNINFKSTEMQRFVIAIINVNFTYLYI